MIICLFLFSVWACKYFWDQQEKGVHEDNFLKHLIVVGLFRSLKSSAVWQSDTSWSILFETLTPFCYSYALSLTQKKIPFSLMFGSVGVNSIAKCKWLLSCFDALRHLRYPQEMSKYSREHKRHICPYSPAGCKERNIDASWLVQEMWLENWTDSNA